LKYCTASSKVYGLVGHPVSGSLSPIIHCTVFSLAGVDAFYAAWDVRDGIDDFIKASRLMLAGFNVTIPFKEKVLELLDHVEGEASVIGAVNTVVNKEGRLYGYNTDYLGVARCLGGSNLDKVLVIGAGGAARAAIYALSSVVGVDEIVIVNRTRRRARMLAAWSERLGVRASWGGLEDAVALGRGASLIINATPLGSYACCPDTMPPVAALLARGVLVFDMVYRPLETLLLREARRRGARIIDGLCMLIWQALYADRLWVGIEVSEELYRRVRSIVIEEVERWREKPS